MSPPTEEPGPLATDPALTEPPNTDQASSLVNPINDQVVMLADVLDLVSKFLTRFIVFGSPHQVVACVLWVAHCFLIDAADLTPYIHITAPEKRSGKTRLLELLEMLVERPMSAADISPAALYRMVDKEKPVVLIDEVDGLFRKGRGGDQSNEDLRRLLNAGWQRGKKVYRMGGPKGTIPETFEAFCPKVLCGIGNLPDTLADRSIRIALKRRAPGEPVEKLRRRDVGHEAKNLRVLLNATTSPLLDLVAIARPKVPDQLDDRAVDAWEVLLAIADMADGPWPEAARRAALALTGGKEPEDDTIGVRLLADIEAVFGDHDRMRTVELLAALHDLPETPWSDWFGKPLTDIALAKLLRPFGVRSKVLKLTDGTTARGFLREVFTDPLSRYVTQTRNPVTIQSEQGKSEDRTSNTVTDPKPEILNDDGESYEVTALQAFQESGEEEQDIDIDFDFTEAEAHLVAAGLLFEEVKSTGLPNPFEARR
jgi:hypothetical protein